MKNFEIFTANDFANNNMNAEISTGFMKNDILEFDGNIRAYTYDEGSTVIPYFECIICREGRKRYYKISPYKLLQSNLRPVLTMSETLADLCHFLRGTKLKIVRVGEKFDDKIVPFMFEMLE